MVDAILGRRNPMTAFLQGDSGYSGEGEPLVIFTRLFPDRSLASATDPASTATAPRGRPAGRGR